MFLLIRLISYLSNILTLLVFVQAVLSFILAPYHPIREALDRIVEPLLRPIRRLMPATGMLDFSPLVLIILIQLVTTLLINLLAAF